MSNLFKLIPKEYFAAANGFTGFRSYFDKIFDRNNLKKLFIIKGGPGTGKSSFMKKCASEFESLGSFVEYIYCSSDPSSLDGIIIDGKIGIIDGTAPHEVDTRLPGAFDEIINLGQMWRDETLISKRKIIEDINRVKSENYKSAYIYLSFCKILSDYIISILKESLNEHELLSDLKRYFDAAPSSQIQEDKIRLLSSFSSSGYNTRKTDLYGKNVMLDKTSPLSYTVLDFIKNEFSGQRIIIPSPLHPDVTEGIIYPQLGISFLTGECDKYELDAEKYFKANINKVEVDYLLSTVSSHMKYSQEYFKKASRAHFSLEEIYTGAMDFNSVEDYRKETVERINKIL